MSEDSTIFVATETFAADVDGVPYMIRKGVDRVRGAHPLYKQTKAAGYWAPVEDRVTWDVEQATREPGEKRGAAPTEVTIVSPPEAEEKAAPKGKSAGSSK